MNNHELAYQIVNALQKDIANPSCLPSSFMTHCVVWNVLNRSLPIQPFHVTVLKNHGVINELKIQTLLLAQDFETLDGALKFSRQCLMSEDDGMIQIKITDIRET